MPERRNLNRKDVQTIVEIFPEFGFVNHRSQVAIRRRDYTQVEAARYDIAEPAKLPVLKHPQQLCLKTPRSIRDFIEEQRASVCLFE